MKSDYPIQKQRQNSIQQEVSSIFTQGLGEQSGVQGLTAN